jgi:hypothetical protein
MQHVLGTPLYPLPVLKEKYNFKMWYRNCCISSSEFGVYCGVINIDFKIVQCYAMSYKIENNSFLKSLHSFYKQFQIISIQEETKRGAYIRPMDKLTEKEK